MKLTKQQKQEKRQRDNLQHVINKLLSAFSFKQIKTWRDVYVTSGLDTATINSTYTNSDVALTFSELKKYCDDLKFKLEESIKGRSAPAVVTLDPVKVSEPIVEPQLTNKLDDDYGLVPSENEKAFLYWFQKKATAELLSGFGITN